MSEKERQMQPFKFEVTIVTHTLEDAQEVLRKRLAPAKVLGDPNDPATLPFAYIVGDVVLIQTDPE